MFMHDSTSGPFATSKARSGDRQNRFEVESLEAWGCGGDKEAVRQLRAWKVGGARGGGEEGF
jgi:hypothetical protein